MNESKMGRNVVDGGRSTKNLGYLKTGYIHSGGDLGNHPLELEMNVKWDGTITLRVTQGGPLRVGSLDRYRNSSLSLRIIDILIQLQADVLQPRFSQLI